MTIQRMDHVGVVVDDLAAAVTFFVELGMEVQTPDGHGRLELTKFTRQRPESETGDATLACRVAGFTNERKRPARDSLPPQPPAAQLLLGAEAT